MNIVFITARYDGDEFESYLAPSINKINAKCVNVSDNENSTNVSSIANKYSAGVRIVDNQGLLQQNSIIIFVKGNVKIIDSVAIDKLTHIFTEKPNVGVVGISGIREINKDKDFYDLSNKPVNGIVYKGDTSESIGNHVKFSKQGYYDDVVGIDDCFFAVRGKLLFPDRITFESDSNSGMGTEVALKALDAGYDVASADILVYSNEHTNCSADVINSITERFCDKSFPITSKKFKKAKGSVVDIEL